MKNELRTLRRRLILQVLLAALVSLLVGGFVLFFFVDGIFQDLFANAFVGFCRQVFRMDYEKAATVYRSIFRDNKSVWLLLGFLALLLVCLNVAFRRFTRYFTEIIDGVDRLADDRAGDIALSPELEFMERKLNSIKNTLEKRSRDAKEAEQRKNDLVVYLAHDIKTPLTSVIGYLSLLEETPDLPLEQKAKYIGITLDKAYRLEQLINEFFEITRFNLQTIVLDRQPVNLSVMLAQMTDEFYPVLSEQGKSIALETEDNLTVYADVDKLARVFQNVIKNAIAYGDPGTEIRLRACRMPPAAVITVTNAGRTIPKEKLNSIFEKFYRLDSSRRTNTGGAGLGLAIAKEIMMAHGGNITAASDQGITVFTITLPDVLNTDYTRPPLA